MREEVAARLSVMPGTTHNTANPTDLSHPDIELPCDRPARGKPEAAN
ncbi:hypothetical protein [Bradyrhizobium sp. RDM12]